MTTKEPVAFSESSNVLHRISPPKTAWTRVNVAEIMPGVQTPLSWSFWDSSAERYLREAYFDLGLGSSLDSPDPAEVDQRLLGIFYGRIANNILYYRRWYGALPGRMGAEIEQAFLADLVEPEPVKKPRHRYPVVVAKIAYQLAVTPRRARTMVERSTAWWRAGTSLAPTPSLQVAVQRLNAGRDRLCQVFRVSVVASVLSGLFLQQAAALAARAGRAELAGALASGYDTLDAKATADLWAVSRGVLSLPAFLERWGFRAPLEGELSAPSWRQDPAPLERLLVSYRAMRDDEGPELGEQQRRTERQAAMGELLEALPAHQRLRARLTLRAAATFVPLRNDARTATIQMLDVVRAAIHDVGAVLASAGTIDSPSDVVYLTIDELTAVVPEGARTFVTERRALRERYQQLDLPYAWTGNPTPIEFEPDHDGARKPINGVGVSGGVAEGVAKVVLEPSSGELLPGEILVCEATDVSWISFFVIAAGVVMDTGTVLSHGSIASREMGIPCVVANGVGTRRIQTGDRIRLDGDTGLIEFLDS